MTDPLSDLEIDPLFRYLRDLATPGHRRVLESKQRLLGVTAAQRAGKTTLLRASAAAYFRGMHPWRKRTKPVRILVVAPSMMQLATIYKKGFFDASMLHVTAEQEARWPGLRAIVEQPLIPADEIRQKKNGQPDIQWGISRYGKVPSYVPHIDGSEMYFHISGDPNSWKRIEGMDFHAIFRDESAGDENIGNTFITRLMEHWDKDDYPDAGFYVWASTELQIVQERLDFMKACRDGKKYHGYYELHPDDNPKVTQQNRQDAADILGQEEADKRVWGITGAVSGSLIYGRHFSRNRHVLNEPREPSAQANLWVGWDPGFRHPFGLVCGFIEPLNPFQIIIDRCYFDTGKTLDFQVNCLLEWLDGRRLEGLVYDSTGATKSDYAKGEKAFVQFERALTQAQVKIVRGFLPGRNVYKDTVPAVWRYLDPDPRNINAEPLLLLNPETPAHPGMDRLIDQFYTYRYKEGAKPELKAENIHRLNDEGVDGVRYLISRQPRWQQREPNVKRHQPIATSAIPFPARTRQVDPFADDPSATPEERAYRLALRQSRELAQMRMGKGIRRMPERYIH